ncbi:MAG TPA: PEP/pyruvate-binding domain-containing protein [Acidimicrobiia bacterium]|nr:PEP/pyruvate-binding domain-containing protein [Acidimicrobiia bacterium]
MSHEQVLDLDDPRCYNPRLAGAKASWLARGRHQGLSVLPGVVVTADVSMPALQHGAETLALRGSGGARLEVGQFHLGSPLLARVTQACAGFGPALAVRSSSVLEGAGEWSGAFASYVDVGLQEIEKAIAGCWASAFTVSTLERFEAVGRQPVTAPMAVLIQPLIRPEYGGVARLDQNGDVEIIGIKGSPAPLVQGWESGVRVVVAASDEIAASDDAIAYLGLDLITEVTRQLRAAHRLTAANHCEWGLAEGRLSLLQLARHTFTSRPAGGPDRRPHRAAGSGPGDPHSLDPRLIDLARLARRYPGPLGETLVLAWAAADPSLVIETLAWSATELPAHDDPDDPVEALHLAAREAAILTAETWQMPDPMAAARAASILRQARGNHPEAAVDCLAGLRIPDPERAARVLHLLAIVQRAIDEGRPGGSRWNWHQPIDRLGSILRGETQQDASQSPVQRIGIDRWEPFQAAVVESVGTGHQGTPASPGIGCGRLCFIAGPDQVDDFRPRDIVVTTTPIPNLAPLLWVAAGLVTISGSPAAHLFESARSLNVPAVCSLDLAGSLGVDLAATTGQFAVAVDGSRGVVFTSQW